MKNRAVVFLIVGLLFVLAWSIQGQPGGACGSPACTKLIDDLTKRVKTLEDGRALSGRFSITKGVCEGKGIDWNASGRGGYCIVTFTREVSAFVVNPLDIKSAAGYLKVSGGGTNWTVDHTEANTIQAYTFVAVPK